MICLLVIWIYCCWSSDWLFGFIIVGFIVVGHPIGYLNLLLLLLQVAAGAASSSGGVLCPFSAVHLVQVICSLFFLFEFFSFAA